MYTRILVAIDSSDTAKKALDEAMRIAGSSNAALCIVHALDEGPISQHAMGLGTYIDIEKIKSDMRQAAGRLLENAVGQAAASGIKAETMVLESERKRTAEQIADGARQWKADLIVVGTHGRRGVDRLLVGSVAENLTRLAETSLLLVR